MISRPPTIGQSRVARAGLSRSPPLLVIPEAKWRSSEKNSSLAGTHPVAR